MKAVMFAASFGLALAGLPAITMAACAAPSVRVNTLAALTTLLQSNTACVPPVTVDPMTWQELHVPGGALVDYKRGADTVDPSKQVGDWAVTGFDGRAFVRYRYGTAADLPAPWQGGTYTYQVWDNQDGTHSFCGGIPAEIVGRIKLGGGAC